MVRSLVCVKQVNGSLGLDTAIKRVVALRVDLENTAGRTEMYKLARPTVKPWKTTARVVAAGVIVTKGAYLLELQYYKFERTEQASSHRAYILQTGPGSTFIVPLVCVVHNLGGLSFFAIRRTVDHVDEYILHNEVHDKILSTGAIAPE